MINYLIENIYLNNYLLLFIYNVMFALLTNKRYHIFYVLFNSF